MPLSASGKKILERMIREYGAEEGKRIFYSKENEDPKFAHLVKHGHKKKRKHGKGD